MTDMMLLKAALGLQLGVQQVGYWHFAAALAAVWGGYVLHTARAERRSRGTKTAAIEAGMTEPSSLHPVVSPALCIGCGACVKACPERGVLGLINDKAELIEPTSCIGHGACKTACPAGAISLVFGTATRGVDIPHVSPSFESNVPGLYIAGELGGMGLIANAIEQGRQAVGAIAALPGIGSTERLDLVIVGSGPAGLSASLAAREAKLKFVTLEQDAFGGTVAHYPRGKIVMTKPAHLPLYGKFRLGRVRKEKLLAVWGDAARKHRLPIRFNERVEHVKNVGDGFEVTSSRGRYLTRCVLLAIGRNGSPRKLGVPGEELDKVVYRLVEAAQYRGQRVLVVGGGDSALEAAAALALEPRTEVILAHRGAGFARAKPVNRKRIEALVSRGHVRLLLESRVEAITPEWVDVVARGRRLRIANDAVLVCAGGVLPGAFLGQLGVAVETKYGTL